MSARYTILHLARASTTEALGGSIKDAAAILGVDEYTARQRLVGTGLVVIAQVPEEVEARRQAKALDELGFPAMVVDEAALPLGEGERVRGVAPDGRALILTGLEGRPVGRIAPGEPLLMVPQGLVGPDELLRGHPRPDAVSERTRITFFKESGERFTLRPSGFSFQGLPERALGVGENVRRLLALFEGCAALKAHLGYPTNYERPEAREGERYAAYAFAAWRAGLLSHPALAAAVVPGLKVGVSDILSAVPLRRRALGYFPRFRPGGVGFYGLYAAVFLLGIISNLAHERGEGLRGVFQGLLALTGAVAVAAGLRWLARSHRMVSVPTSRVRSVAMGLAELKGRVEPAHELLSPFGRVPCAWYQFRLERYDETEISWWALGLRAFAGRRFFGHCYGGGAYQVVIEGDSGDLPFYLRDDTGRIRIEPEGATWHLKNRSSDTVDQRGLRYRVTERLLPVGTPLYVLGTVARAEESLSQEAEVVSRLRALKRDPQALAGYDLDGDGHIDAEEWALARQAVQAEVAAQAALRTREDTVLVGAARGEPFILSDRDEDQLASRLKWWAKGSLAVGAVALIYGLKGLLAVWG